MKTIRSSGAFKPFKDLKRLLKKRSLRFSPPLAVNADRPQLKTDGRQNYAPKAKPHDVDQVLENEKKMFLEAMADVKPMQRSNRIEIHSTANLPSADEDNLDNEVLQDLQQLVESGKGFVVADTAEYVEGTGYNVNPEFARRLHRGDFSIQAHIDLHGLSVEDAWAAFGQFLKDSVLTGKRAVLIVHGRGLSSPAKPILKTKVVEWLSCGEWRKWVIAFSSARLYDGGAGATYVLLRRRPVTRSQRKKTG